MNVIKNLLSTIETATGITPKAFNSSTIQTLPCISYTAFRQYDDAVKESWRFQTRITASSLLEAIELEEIIASELCSLGDEGSQGALNIVLNGGGTLEDENTGLPQILTYYDITTKSF